MFGSFFAIAVGLQNQSSGWKPAVLGGFSLDDQSRTMKNSTGRVEFVVVVILLRMRSHRIHHHLKKETPFGRILLAHFFLLHGFKQIQVSSYPLTINQSIKQLAVLGCPGRFVNQCLGLMGSKVMTPQYPSFISIQEISNRTHWRDP